VRESKIGNWLLNAATAVVTIAAVAVAWVRVSEYRTRNDPVEVRPTKIQEWRDYSTEGIALGVDSARVTLVEFSDFFCPFCRKAAPDIRQVRNQFPQDVRFVYRHLPLVDASYPAAIAAECASRTGHFDAFHDLLFELVDSVETETVTTIAQRAGIADTTTFKSCTNDKSALAAVQRDVQAAKRLGITGTPTILINDSRFPANPGAERMIEMVAKLLK
jgi:protein-disulfide isomerase